MALDGIVTGAIVRELGSCVGARIHKIHQPGPHELVLQIRGAGVQGKLLLSANPTYPRVHWTKQTYTNPLEAPMFCMLLRKYCEGGVIEAIEQPGCERIIHMTVRRRDELGDESRRRLVIELMGRHSNIILLDPESGTIHDGIHHVTPAISSYRIVMPGSPYTAPPAQHKADPYTIADPAQFAAALNLAAAEAPPEKRLMEAFAGFSPLLARETAHRAGGQGAGVEALYAAFADLMAPIRRGAFTPCIVTRPDGKSFFSVTELTHLDGERQTFDGVSACLEAYYGDKAERDTVKQRASDLLRFLQNERAKNEKKLGKLQDTLAAAADADRHRVLGELLTAYMHQIEPGSDRVEVVDYYDPEQRAVQIELDPQLTPSENAQRHFRRYTKAKNSVAAVQGQLESAHAEIRYLDELLQQLDTAALGDIEEIRDELVEQGYLKARSRRGPKKKKNARPALLHYTSSEDKLILVGKNNTQNDYLTNKLAAQHDTWLHTKDIPGSHVLIRGTDYGDATLEEAAMLAAHYSKARASSQVPIDYTAVRHVRKPSGAKPGYVIYDHQKTLFITPDEQRLSALPCQIK
ncbi:NFACT family protein [Paenibacillus sp. IB182496]|uniref:Rqc2 homolog RqcH n=1 Tax=Paenibacillus sabuli TaxID=2772509 RepID=A0A927BVA9_9BACL|nr:NFACT RNA binding domain-containing protein [Paenibacillus sabuli]MBD2846169.1 NFACT family protein [Paenibacillus sabuli]